MGIKWLKKVINPDQTPINISDKPVFTLTKQIQWECPSLFDIQKYFSLFGGLHIEKSLLVIHGKFIKGVGLAPYTKDYKRCDIVCGKKFGREDLQ